MTVVFHHRENRGADSEDLEGSHFVATDKELVFSVPPRLSCNVTKILPRGENLSNRVLAVVPRKQILLYGQGEDDVCQREDYGSP